MRKSFAVIGLGSFGRSVAEELIALDADILCIDSREDRINKISKIAQNAVICDSTDEEALRDLGLGNIDHVIICIGNDIQASIMTTLIAKDLGVKKVTVKVLNEYHAKVVERVGAEEIIYPERQMGRRFARRIISDSILEVLELTSDFSYVEVVTPKDFVGKTIIELDVRRNYGVNVVSVKRGNQIITPTAAGEIEEEDILMIVGSNKEIAKF